MASPHAEAPILAFVTIELGERRLDLRAYAHIAQFFRETMDDDREQHVARSAVRTSTVQRGFGVAAEPFAEFLADGGETIESDILEKFHGRSGRW